jgi:hypothetical protein
LTRSDALEIPKGAVACQREDGALWIRALDDPVAIQHFNRVSEDLSATSLDALYGRVNVAGIVATLAVLHPLEYVAMNALTGVTRGAYDTFELDYWFGGRHRGRAAPRASSRL